MEIEIREYREEDEQEWMRVHAIILSISHAWNYSIQERPNYEGYESTRLVAIAEGRIVGLTDTQYENEPGELCFLNDSRGGYVLEFGRLPEFAGHNIGRLLIDATVEDAKRKGFHRLEFWTQDRAAQRYYARLGMREIGRHYRFRMKATEAIDCALEKGRIGIEYLYCVCLPEEWPRIKQQYEIITRHPLEPHLCIGYEIRF
ncbi:MAG TPA: GNAT family N-acetyltransferase [Candidatus Hydrogenedentes bacterium]|nr:GNAT family N-acetyltransferase [Candidatus Hydrogenedentota bacterium]HOL77026.1 GNAT family N-acetyltransferase [Candidatus Hydrogenedentota bacterium]HPO85791.1 GNAT family N-acetyltransferase [Candidatus Hydrogenedentota bacterium]